MAVLIQCGPCLVCNKTSAISMPNEAFRAWRKEGAYLQDAWPDSTADEREMLISGIHPYCFDYLYLSEEDEKDQLNNNTFNWDKYFETGEF